MRKALSLAVFMLLTSNAWAQDRLIDAVDAATQSKAKMIQVMVDQIFSFSELGFQEVETSRYVTGILERNGFDIQRGTSGIPTAWWASWGSGKPVIAFGSDIDGIPKSNQKPGVAYHDPLVPGAPGHGEGHNSGQAVNVAAALALKEVMEREGISGTLVLWPGVAEELLGSKAWFVRDGAFSDVDLVFFTHVSSSLQTSYGQGSGTGLVSVQFSFQGEAAHGAGDPWRGRSALDAVELMNVGWNFRREHLHPLQRSHYVIVDGGDQPNVVPANATVWYYIREMDYEGIARNYEIGKNIAQGAALMTDTEMSYKVVGAAWPRHFNKVIAENMYTQIQQVGLPEWTEDDQRLARALQKELGNDERGLNMELDTLRAPGGVRTSGGSDDIGDVSWAVPTVTLRFPANMPGIQGHHWSSAVAMATPIAHKGSLAGARVMARTAMQFFANPELVGDAWDYYRDVQTRDMTYTSFLSDSDAPPIEMNKGRMAQYRGQLEQYYFDPERYDTYLEQLGITYPTLRQAESQSDDQFRSMYEQGKTYEEFVEGAERRHAAWLENSENGTVPDDILRRATAVGGTWRLLAVAVDGCSDSVGTIPYLADLVDAVDGLEMRIIGSEAGLEIMQSHRTPDGRPATPTVLLLDSEFDEAGVFIERPTPLQEWAQGALDSLGVQEFLKQKAAWYEEDLGRLTMEEVVVLMETASGSR
jgi:aminobenzoyl-glutamate utilization protein B